MSVRAAGKKRGISSQYGQEEKEGRNGALRQGGAGNGIVGVSEVESMKGVGWLVGEEGCMLVGE